MRKLSNIILGLTFMVTYVMVELYPTLKMGAKIYANKLDFSSLSNFEPVAEYSTYLSHEEKCELKNMMMDYCNSILD